LLELLSASVSERWGNQEMEKGIVQGGERKTVSDFKCGEELPNRKARQKV
jgi:hypothetical protein